MNIGIIILAAGSSSRMGESKQLLKISNVPLLVKTIQTALLTEMHPIIVVLGSDENAHRNIIKNLTIHIAINNEWQRGMGSSLKAGMKDLLAHAPKTEGVIVMVCDQPLVDASLLNLLKIKHLDSNKPIIASRYAGTAGVPAFFHRSFFSEILNLSDEEGAKRIIQLHPSQTVFIDFPGGEIDLDTAEDYKDFTR